MGPEGGAKNNNQTGVERKWKRKNKRTSLSLFSILIFNCPPFCFSGLKEVTDLGWSGKKGRNTFVIDRSREFFF